MTASILSSSARLRRRLSGQRIVSRRTWRRTAGSLMSPRARLVRSRKRKGAVATACAAAFVLAAPWWLSPLRWPALQQLHERALTRSLVDARGRWLGALPPANDADAPYHAVPAEDAPEGFFRMLLALEDRHLDERTLHGIDVLRMARQLGLALTGHADGGGSGLYMQLARSLHGMRPGGETPLPLRKLVEVVDGMVLHHQLGGREGRAFRAWLATHLPFAIAAPGVPLGTDIRGLELAARVLFGRSARELTLAQQAVLAAAVRHPVRLAPWRALTARQRAALQRRWKRTKLRAAFGLKLAFDADHPLVRAALAELRDMPPPHPTPEKWVAALAGPDPIRRLRAAANPAARAVLVAGRSLLEVARREARRKATVAPRLALGIDIVANNALRRRIRGHLLARRPLLGMDAWREADVLVAAVDEHGTLRRLVSNRADAWQRPYPAAEAPRLLLAQVVAEAIGSCGDAEGEMPQTACTAQTPRDLLANVPEARIRQLARETGLHLPPDMPPREALLAGAGRISPRDAAALALRVARMLTSGHLLAEEPHLLERSALGWDGTTASLSSAANTPESWRNEISASMVLSDAQRRLLPAMLSKLIKEHLGVRAPERNAMLLAVPVRYRKGNKPLALVALLASRDGRLLPSVAGQIADELLLVIKQSMEEASSS